MWQPELSRPVEARIVNTGHHVSILSVGHHATGGGNGAAHECRTSICEAAPTWGSVIRIGFGYHGINAHARVR
eukprot:scaffold36191_cov26-Tisochrysis_lutea.AAC.4